MRGFVTRFILLAAVALTGCAYHFGYSERSLPGGFKEVAIPMFKNETRQVGAEAYFTEDLVRDFHRSQVAKVVSENVAPIVIEGKITNISYTPEAQIYSTNQVPDIQLPDNTVLNSSYRVDVSVHIQIRRQSDQKIIWQGNFDDETAYQAPLIGLGTINSADALYDHSARNQVVAQLAKDMMDTAHDRITENF